MTRLGMYTEQTVEIISNVTDEIVHSEKQHIENTYAGIDQAMRRVSETDSTVMDENGDFCQETAHRSYRI